MPIRGEHYTFSYITDNSQQWLCKNNQDDVITYFDNETKDINTVPPIDDLCSQNDDSVDLFQEYDEEYDDPQILCTVQPQISTNDWCKPITMYRENGIQNLTDSDRAVLQSNNQTIFESNLIYKQIITVLECLK